VFFAFHPQSPIPPNERVNFTGLEYYPPDPKYLFELELEEHTEKKIVVIMDTTGNLRKFIRWGVFRFQIDGKEYALQAYKDNQHEKGFFVPFRDATNGDETYEAGRYLDLNPENDQTVSGKYLTLTRLIIPTVPTAMPTRVPSFRLKTGLK